MSVIASSSPGKMAEAPVGGYPASVSGPTRPPAPLLYLDCGTIEILREGGYGSGARKKPGETRLVLTVPRDEAEEILKAFCGHSHR